jgi:hypothetical protein
MAVPNNDDFLAAMRCWSGFHLGNQSQKEICVVEKGKSANHSKKKL